MLRSSDRRPSGYFTAFDGLRTATCVGVVVSHAFPDSAFWGRLGIECVSIFFSLSGFLITTLLLAERRENGRVDLMAFYIRRTIRIWPVYFAAIGATILGAFVLGDRFLRPLGFYGTPHDLLVVLRPYFLFVGNWNLTPPPTSVQILWSISVEEQFYMLFPLCLVLVPGPKPVLLLSLLGVALSIGARALLLLTGHGQGLEFNTFSHGEHLLFGALLAQFAFSTPSVAARIHSKFSLAWQLGLLALWLSYLAYVGRGAHERGIFFSIFRFTASALLSTAFVALFAFGRGFFVDLARRRIPSYLGQLTYAAYAFHILPLVAIWGITNAAGIPVEWAPAVRAILSVPAAFLVAFAVRHLFEKRLNRLRSRFHSGKRSRSTRLSPVRD